MMTMMVVAAAAAYDVVSGVTLDSAAGGLWAGSTRRGDARQNMQAEAEDASLKKRVEAEGGVSVGGRDER